MGHSVDDILASMRSNPKGVRFSDAVRVAAAFFGEPRCLGGSHQVFRMPWPLDPRVNLQPDKNGKAKAYQIKQLLQAVEKLTASQENRGESGNG